MMFNRKDAENVARDFLHDYDPDMIYTSIEDLMLIFESYYYDGFHDKLRNDMEIE